MSQKQDGRNIYVIMKTMCPPGYHHNVHIYIYIYINLTYPILQSTPQATNQEV